MFYQIKSTRRSVHCVFLALVLAALILPLRAASPAQASAPAAPAQAQGIDNGLVGYWPFDEGSGSTSGDLSGNGNTATLHTPNSFTGNAAPTDIANPSAFASASNANSYATAPG